MKKKLIIPEIYNFENVDAFLELFDNEKFVKSTRKIEYLNAPVAFDIETTSFSDERGEKRGLMYAWTFGLRFGLIQGRTWSLLQALFTLLSRRLNLSADRRMVVYVHNLEFEFQFMRKYFEWERVFAIRDREPLYALTKEGIEFRCSYKLTNYSLDRVAEGLTDYEIRKLKGNLDYSKIRHQDTPLTDKELDYMYNDVLIITALITERIAAEGNIAKIPLTATGYVRRLTRRNCMRKPGSKRNWNFWNTIKRLRISEAVYGLAKEAFQGGFTHANAWYVRETLEEVASQDITSSYPAVLCRERFPMDAGELYRPKSYSDFLDNLNIYCCLFEVQFIGLKSRVLFEHPLSASKCYDTLYPMCDNGRIVEAAELKTTITEQDFFILNRFYNWSNIKIGRFYRFKKRYLPRELIATVLDIYEKKTKLKGVAGKEAEYQHLKELLNSIYGMMVTEICRPEYKYNCENNAWDPRQEPNIAEALEQYNESQNRFLFYPWGVWCTAYARRSLFEAIFALGNDYIYADTDSVKYLNQEKHAAFFEAYNAENRKRMLQMCKKHDFDPRLIEPETLKGTKKLLGAWDYEGTYDRFKTLGAKRYLTLKGDIYGLTVSGLSKTKCVPWMLKKYGSEIFERFDEHLNVPGEYTGKQTHTYIDRHTSGIITDYTGLTRKWESRSGIHLEPAPYYMLLSRTFRDYLLGLKDRIF